MTSTIFTKLRNLPSIYLTQVELKHYLDGTENSRYSMIKRSVTSGLLIRIRRGLYCLGDQLTWLKHHPYELALRVYAMSFISLESALSYHGLIPEVVHVVTSVTPRRSKTFSTPLGDYAFYKVPKINFMVSVERIDDGGAVYFMATPWRAITDYVYCYKKDWISLEPLAESLRIELDDLPRLSDQEATLLMKYYNSARVTKFLTYVAKEQYYGD